MKKYAVIDKSTAPIFWVKFTGEKASDESFEKYLAEVKACYDGQQPLAIIFDASHAVLPSIFHQKKQAEWLKENEQVMKDYCKGTAYIIPQLAVRKVLKLIFAFQQQPVSYTVCRNKTEAENWVKEQLGE